MKKIIWLVFLFLLFVNNSSATELKGGVFYTVNSAREYVQDGQMDFAKVPTGYYKLRMENTEKVVYSYNNQSEVIGITVQYVNEPATAYIYSKSGDLIYIDEYDKPVNIYPHRGYRYDLSGNLILSSLTVSKNEMFRFDPDGSLIAHSINGIIYDENGNVIGHGK